MRLQLAAVKRGVSAPRCSPCGSQAQGQGPPSPSLSYKKLLNQCNAVLEALTKENQSIDIIQASLSK